MTPNPTGPEPSPTRWDSLFNSFWWIGEIIRLAIIAVCLYRLHQLAYGPLPELYP